jgi:hypothetical protein
MPLAGFTDPAVEILILSAEPALALEVAIAVVRAVLTTVSACTGLDAKIRATGVRQVQA